MGWRAGVGCIRVSRRESNIQMTCLDGIKTDRTYVSSVMHPIHPYSPRLFSRRVGVMFLSIKNALIGIHDV